MTLTPGCSCTGTVKVARTRERPALTSYRARQIALLDFRTAAPEFGGRTRQLHATALKYIRAIADIQDQPHLLLDKDDSRSLIGRCPDRDEQALDNNGGKPKGQLVSEQDLGLAGQGSPEPEHLLFAAGQQPGLPAKQGLERREEPHRLGGVTIAKPQILPGRKLPEDRSVIADQRHAQLCPAMQAAWRRLPCDGDLPAEGRDGAGDGQQCGCLA